MALNNLVQRLMQEADIQGPLQAHRSGNVKCRSPGSKLINEPQALLRERNGGRAEDRAPRDRRYRVLFGAQLRLLPFLFQKQLQEFALLWSKDLCRTDVRHSYRFSHFCFFPASMAGPWATACWPSAGASFNVPASSASTALRVKASGWYSIFSHSAISSSR